MRRLQWLKELSSGDPASNSVWTSLAKTMFRFRWVMDIAWWQQALFLEFRSLAGRIRTLRGRRTGRAATDCGPLYEVAPSGQLRLSLETTARIQGIEALTAKYPWASEADWMLALEGWEMGRGFSRCNAGTTCTDTETSPDTPAISGEIVCAASVSHSFPVAEGPGA
jgi:hypothetical protein